MRNVPYSYYATITGSLSIAVGLVVVSYGHIRKFAMEAGAAAWEAAVIAVTVDALVVLSIAAIGHARGVGQPPPAMAKIALIVGIVATTGANIHHGLDHGWMGIVVSLWVPVAAELAYQLAMSAVRVGATGQQEQREVICGHHVPVSTVMARVHAKPVICGHDVPVAMLAATLVAVRRPAPRDPRSNICTRVVAMATLAATMPPRPVATVEQVDPRPDICGQFVPLSEVAMPERPVICTAVIPVTEVAMPPVDTRRPVCTRPVTVAEVLALSPVATPAPVATPTPRPRPANQTAATAEDVAAREEAVLDWLTAPNAPDDRLATATGPDVVAILAAAGHTVAARTARRILKDVRDQLATVAA